MVNSNNRLNRRKIDDNAGLLGLRRKDDVATKLIGETWLEHVKISRYRSRYDRFWLI